MMVLYLKFAPQTGRFQMNIRGSLSMSKNEIDAVEEYEKTQADIANKIEKRKPGQGSGRIFGIIIIILTIAGGAGVIVFKKFFDEKKTEQGAQVLPGANTEIKRTFSVPPSEPELPAASKDEAKEPSPPPVDTVSEEQPPLDQNGLTPEQAAKMRRLNSSFSGKDQENSNDEPQPATATTNDTASHGLGDDGADKGLENSLSSVQTGTVKAWSRKSLDLMLTRGNSIPCSLTRAIDSTVPGQIVCVTIAPVMSSSGKVLLLETGTTFVGNYQSDLSQGRSRIQATFDRLETPGKVFMNIRAPGIGPMGQGGIDGDIDTQFGARFSNTILLATIQDTIANGTSRLGKGDSNGVNLNNTTQASSDLATETLKNSINIPAILRKNPGEIINIDVLQDMDFSSVYRIEHVE
ncbi:TrbI/VirB10 family protein [Cronobacter sakazakii]|nr:TrbI/VirB10 family protein [Cronobacter sakazakii]